MRTLVLIALAAIVAAVGLSLPAEAAPTFATKLSTASATADGGSTQTYTMTVNRRYCIQCESPACMAISADAGVTAACTLTGSTDYMVPVSLVGVTQTPEAYPSGCFDNGGLKYIVARARDGGNPNCSLFTDSLNPPNR